MKYNIYITYIKPDSLLTASKLLGIYLDCAVLEMKRKLMNLPAVFVVDSKIIDKLNELEAVFTSHSLEKMNKEEIDKEIKEIDLNDLEIRDGAIFHKGTSLFMLVEKEELFEEIVKRINLSKN